MRLYRIFFACLTIAAIASDLLQSTNLINFFSYFTVLSNLFAAFIFLYGSIKKPSDSFRGAAVLYMIITALVYAVLLEHPQDHSTWTNIVLHKIMPVSMLFDWVFAPLSSKLTIKDTVRWLLFPLLYAGDTFIRGFFVDWYPYSFLNPQEKGYFGVLLYCLAIIFCAWVVAVVIVLIGNKRSDIITLWKAQQIDKKE